jgi:hypothetical protein
VNYSLIGGSEANAFELVRLLNYLKKVRWRFYLAEERHLPISPCVVVVVVCVEIIACFRQGVLILYFK